MKKNNFYNLFLISFWVLILGIAIPMKGQTYGTNLVLNPGFEDVTNTAWTFYAFNSSISTSNFISGSKSALYNNITNGQYGNSSQVISVTAGATYKFGYTGRALDAAGPTGGTCTSPRKVTGEVRQGNSASGAVLVTLDIASGTNTTVSGEFTVPVGVTQVYVRTIKSFGVCYVDDVTLQLKQWNIATSVNDGAMGNVSGGGSAVASGSGVSLVATPNSGYYFVNWTESGSPISTNSNLPSFSASANRTIIANFAPVTASMTLTGTLSSFSSTYGTVSAEQSFSIAGSSLTTDIVVTTPTGFEVSTTSGSGFQSSVSLTPSSGSVSTTTVYVRLKASAPAATYSAANITVITTGSSQNVSCSGTVAKKTLSVSGTSIANKTYNGLTGTGTITVGTIIGFVGTETITATAVGTYPSPNVWASQTGTIVYTLVNGTNGGLASNYSLANSTAYGNINSKQLDITAVGQSVTYGTAASTVTAAGTYTLSGLQNGELASNVISGTATFTTTYTNTTAAGTASVTITYNNGLSTANGNYWFNKIAGTITITKATPTLSVSGTQSFTYNGSEQGPATISYNGDGGTPTLLYTNTSGTAYSSATAPTNVGNYQVVASATAGTNYNAATSIAYTFSITAATPTVTPTIDTYTYNGNPQGPNVATNTGTGTSYTYSYSGTGNTSYGPSTTLPAAAGTYTVTATVAAHGNYAQASSAATAFSILSPSAIASSSNVSNLTLSPSADLTVAAGATLVIDQSTTVNSVTVVPGANLTVNSNSALNVAGGITLQNTASGTASFVDSRAVDSPTAIAGTVQQDITESNRNWYVSIPVTGKQASDITLTGARIVKRNEAAASWDEVTGSLTAGVGYIAVGSATGGTTTWTLAGNLNSGKVEVPVTHSGASSIGFNLLGNPYPSYLNWEEVLNQNTTNASLLQPTIWYRTAVYNNGLSKFDYSFNTYNSAGRVATPTSTTGYIPPMQAFWVRANSAGTVTFTNAMRSHGNGASNKLKAPSANKAIQQVLRLQVSNGINTDETVIYTNPNASNGYDMYDSPKMSNNNAAIPEIFTRVGSEQLVINGLNSISLNQEILLGLTQGTSSQLSIKATELSNFDSGTQLILRDYLGPNNVVEQDLTNGVAYSFVPTTNAANRFSLVFKAPSVITGIISDDNESDISIFRNGNGQITVSCPTEITGKAIMSIYNAVGQKLENQVLNNTLTVVTTKTVVGVYVVNVAANGKVITRKVIIN